MARIGFDQVHRGIQLVSFVAAIIGMIVALIQFDRYTKSEQRTSQKELTTGSTPYIEFLKLCFQNPRSDCYSIATSDIDPPLSKEEMLQQKILYTILTDLFEVAYIQYKTSRLGIRLQKPT